MLRKLLQPHPRIRQRNKWLLLALVVLDLVLDLALLVRESVRRLVLLWARVLVAVSGPELEPRMVQQLVQG